MMHALELEQNTPEWHAHRNAARNASEAPAVVDASPYVSRADLIRQRATGVKPEHDAATLARFARGHEVEPALRAFAESIIDDELFPVVATSDDGYLSASFDGVNMAETIICEAKQWNAKKAAQVDAGEIPAEDRWQIVQQFAVCDTAEKCIYLVGDGTSENTVHLIIDRAQVEGDIPKLRAAWAQFDADVSAYTPEPAKAEAVAQPVAGFGALSLRVEGRVLASNLDAFKAGAEAFIARLPKPAELQTDQDFVNAAAAVTACSEAEERIGAARAAALAQMADVDTVLRTADEVREAIRAARLALDRVVKAEKENRRVELVRAAAESVRLHYASIAKSLGEYDPGVPASVTADLGAAIKGLKSLASINDKLDATVAQIKIAASQDADCRRENITVIEANHEHQHLLPDRVVLVATKSPDDLRNLIAARVAEHEAKIRKQAEEAAERERERTREEERQRAANEAAAAVTANDPPVAEPARASAATASPAPIPHGAATQQTGGARKPVGKRIKLGDINARIAPLSISAEGLASLGFQPVAVEKAAKLYAESDFADICNVLSARLQRAAAMQEAA